MDKGELFQLRVLLEMGARPNDIVQAPLQTLWGYANSLKESRQRTAPGARDLIALLLMEFNRPTTGPDYVGPASDLALTWAPRASCPSAGTRGAPAGEAETKAP